MQKGKLYLAVKTAPCLDGPQIPLLRSSLRVVRKEEKMIENVLSKIVEDAMRRVMQDLVDRTPPAHQQETKTIQLLTVAETAKILSVSRMTVRRLIDDGQLPAVRAFSATRIDSRDLEAFVAKAKQGGLH